MWEMLFEKIKAWDGVSDTGKDARLKIERNFEKIKTFIGVDLYNFLTQLSETIGLKASIDALNALAEIVDDKAEKTAVEGIDSALQGLVEIVGEKADLILGKVPESQIPTPYKVSASQLSYEFDWKTLFTKNCPWKIYDNFSASSRPNELEAPIENQLPIEYAAQSFGNDGNDVGCALVKRISDNTTYMLKYNGVSTIESVRLVESTELQGEILEAYTALEAYIQDLYTETINLWDKIEEVEEVLADKADLIDGIVPEEQLPRKADLVEGLVPSDQLPSPSKVSTTELINNFDWRDIFTKNCPWQIYDNYTALSRPAGLEVPTGVGMTLIEYAAQSFGTWFGTGVAILKRVDTGELFSLTYDGGDIECKRFVAEEELGTIDDILDILNGDLVGDVQEVIDNMAGI